MAAAAAEAGKALGRPGCPVTLYSVPGSDTTSGLDHGEGTFSDGAKASGGEKQYGDRLCTYDVGFGVVN